MGRHTTGAVRSCDCRGLSAHYRGHSTERRGASWLCEDHVQFLRELRNGPFRQWIDGWLWCASRHWRSPSWRVWNWQ